MRYLALIMLNLPVIMVALVNIVTQYKLRKVSRSRFRHQLLVWSAILLVLVGSFPLYNLLHGRAAFDSAELSLFDIVQTTVIILLFYIANAHRQRHDQLERRLRDLHQALSIHLSATDTKAKAASTPTDRQPD